jgi:PilZ domain-containing protein
MAAPRLVPVPNEFVSAMNGEQRKEPRVFVKMPVRLCFAGEAQEHVGFVRDMSASGMFFYSDLKTETGSELEFIMHLPQHTMDAAQVSCRGVVVRVENHMPGAATGVALRLEQCRVLSSAN